MYIYSIHIYRYCIYIYSDISTHFAIDTLRTHLPIYVTLPYNI